jgi:curli biogenesis system outer membrane secretion channel CsgG
MGFISCSQSFIYTGPHTLTGEHGTGAAAGYQQAAQGRVRSVAPWSGIKERIAVSDFTAKDIPLSIAMNVSELIRTELINTGRYTVIERSQMKEILKEQGFQQTGCTDVSCAVQMGKLLSAKKILVGSLMKMGTKYIITGRIVDVEKGVGERASKGNANSVDQLDRGVTEFVDGL